MLVERARGKFSAYFPFEKISVACKYCNTPSQLKCFLFVIFRLSLVYLAAIARKGEVYSLFSVVDLLN